MTPKNRKRVRKPRPSALACIDGSDLLLGRDNEGEWFFCSLVEARQLIKFLKQYVAWAEARGK